MSISVTGGKLAPEELAKIKRTFEGAPVVKIGVPKGAGRYKDGVHTATVAAVHEFGSADGRVPERSFLRSTLAEMRVVIFKLYKKRLPDVIEERVGMRHVQSEVGQLMVGAVIAKIAKGIPPRNSAKTIAKKKSSKPLIDTGHLRQSITYVVGDDDE